jgi:hypothetical protein
MKAKLIKLITGYRFLFILYCVVAIIGSITQVIKNSPAGSGEHINNFLIFKASFTHLINGGDLYSLWPADHFDYYKYSPAFALLMAPFSLLNNTMGVVIWNLLNALVLFFAVKNIAFQNKQAGIFVLWFILLELLTSMQNCQSNGLMAGLMIAGFNSMETDKPRSAAFCIALSIYIKLFSMLTFVLMLLRPERRKALVTMVLFMVIFAVLPLIAVPFRQLIFLYKSWASLLSQDHSASTGLSVAGWLHSWFKIDPPKNWITVIGFVLLMLPLLRPTYHKHFQFRLLMLASILIWVIIFNHKAESPTFIVAVSGIAIWFFSRPRGIIDKLLLCLVFVFTSLSPTDLFPASLRLHFVTPYVLKAVPCILVWGRIVWEMVVEIKNLSAATDKV